MNRRDFVRSSVVGAAGLALGASALDVLAAQAPVTLTILHTNDVHSRLEPFPAGNGSYANLGGVARRSALIQKIRSKEQHVLVLDAGDIFQGTPYFNFFHGELEMKLMSDMGYEAATMGNHDFDKGIDGFIKQLPHANFPFLVANYRFEESVLKEKVLPYTIIKKGPLRIGIFGLGIELEGLVPKALRKNTQYIDPIGTAKEMVQELQKKNCHLIICLSHLGNIYNHSKVSDQVLAKEVEGIDFIIGGHTHTFLKEPQRVMSKSGKEVLVNQVGWAGINLGRVDFTFSSKNELKKAEGQALLIGGESWG